MQPQPFTSRYDEASRLLTLGGDIEPRAVDQLKNTLRVLASVDLTVDLSDVSFFPSAAVAVLIQARKQSERAGGAVRLRTTGGSLAARVLGIVAVPFETP